MSAINHGIARPAWVSIFHKLQTTMYVLESKHLNKQYKGGLISDQTVFSLWSHPQKNVPHPYRVLFHLIGLQTSITFLISQILLFIGQPEVNS